jgi:hypothetical protein
MARAVIAGALAVVLLLAIAQALAAAPPSAQATEPAGIFQLVQQRGGRRACWGVVIRLDRLAFRPAIEPAQLAIRDDKRDRELRDAMRWTVDSAGKQLTIQWQTGKGDFGTGNGIRVCVERSAFRDGSQPGNDRECWQIGTDLL